MWVRSGSVAHSPRSRGYLLPVLRVRDVYPGSRIRINEFKHFNQKIVSKLTEIRSGLFVPDPDPGSGSWVFTHPGSRGQKGPGSATLLFIPVSTLGRRVADHGGAAGPGAEGQPGPGQRAARPHPPADQGCRWGLSQASSWNGHSQVPYPVPTQLLAEECHCRTQAICRYVIQHCFICRPSDSTVSEDDGIEPSDLPLS